MPGINGIETCLRIRKLMPLLGIVMLSANNNEEDKIQALDAGADDYVTKPFHVEELAARIRSVLRRTRPSKAAPPRSIASDWAGNAPTEGLRPAAIQIGEIEFDPARRLVKRAGTPVHLTPKEFELLHFLMSHAGFPITHARILKTVWGPEYGNELETLRTFVGQLRKKLGDDGASPKYLLTDLQIGYHFVTEADLPVARKCEDHIPARNIYMVSP
jgi:two-component system KDP operon response regulator KdpE